MEAQAVACPGMRASAAEQDDRRPEGPCCDDDLAGADAEGPHDLGRQAALVEDQQPTLDPDRPIALEQDPVDRRIDQEPPTVLCGDRQVATDPGPLGTDTAAERAPTAVAAAGGVALVRRGLVAEGVAALDEQPVLDRDRLGRPDSQLGPDAREVGVRLWPIEALESVVARPALADRRGRRSRSSS
jgi:hypothetical protein